MSEKEFQAFVAKLQRQDTERRVLAPEFSRTLKARLDAAAQQDATFKSISQVVAALVDEVAKLRLDVAELLAAKSMNAALERQVLNRLDAELSRYQTPWPRDDHP